MKLEQHRRNQKIIDAVFSNQNDPLSGHHRRDQKLIHIVFFNQNDPLSEQDRGGQNLIDAVLFNQNDPQLEQHRRDLITAAGRDLDKARMVRFNERTGSLNSTDVGRIASHFYIKRDTIEVSLIKKENHGYLIRSNLVSIQD